MEGQRCPRQIRKPAPPARSNATQTENATLRRSYLRPFRRRALLQSARPRVARRYARHGKRAQMAAHSPPRATPPERVDDGKIRATFVGHSTLLIQLEGLNILCDPIWSHRASPLSWIGPPRHRAPGVHFDQLPTIDLVLQSHDHYDHFDVPTLRRISAQWNPAFAVPLGVGARLTIKGIAQDSQIQELDWWQSA